MSNIILFYVWLGTLATTTHGTDPFTILIPLQVKEILEETNINKLGHTSSIHGLGYVVTYQDFKFPDDLAQQSLQTLQQRE